MGFAINITDGHGLSNEARHKLLLKKEQSNAVLAFLFAVNNHLTNCTLLMSCDLHWMAEWNKENNKEHLNQPITIE